jgi:hypothetical protein
LDADLTGPTSRADKNLIPPKQPSIRLLSIIQPQQRKDAFNTPSRPNKCARKNDVVDILNDLRAVDQQRRYSVIASDTTQQ